MAKDSFCLEAILDRNDIFYYITENDKEKLRQAQKRYHESDFMKQIAIIWKEATIVSEFPKDNYQTFKNVKRVLISLLLQKKTSSEQERMFARLSNASNESKYLSRTLSATIMKQFKRNKNMFDGSKQEEILQRQLLKKFSINCIEIIY